MSDLVQHIDGRQGRVAEVDLVLDKLPAVKVNWFRGPSEIVVLGYVWRTNIEENWERMTTYGVRYHNGYFRVYLMWMDALGDRRWRAHRIPRRAKYRHLDRALRSLVNAQAVMIFSL